MKPLRFQRPTAAEAFSYNGLQRLTYMFVIFILFPLEIWSGLAMSLGFISAFPWSVELLGGRQSARTIHLLCIDCVGVVPGRSCGDGFSCRIPQPYRSDDHGRHK